MRCGLLGRSLSHSYSVPLHGLLGDYSYALFCVEPEALDRFMQDRDFDAINVTIPYKTAVLPYCSSLDDAAKKIGSVNTLIKDAYGRLVGYNTDYFGFGWMADRIGVRFDGKKVLIFGSGGTSLTAQAYLQDQGAREVVVISRTGPDNYDTLDNHADSEILINTTPVGMYPASGSLLIDLRRFPTCSGVLDVIYNPLNTRLLQQAAELGIPYTNGLPMLVAQGLRASELFTGHSFLPGRLETVCQQMERAYTNIILIGMPGSGKTAIGSRLAEKLGRRFLDSDEKIVEQAGMGIPEIFARVEEAGFRQVETGVIEVLGREAGCVLATGGGAVMNPVNRQNLRQNGWVVFCKRPLDLLATAGRPLSTGKDALLRLYEERLPVYETFCDFVVENTGSVDEVADRIVEAFHAHFSH